MTFNTYVIIGSIVMVIDMLNKSEIYDKLWNDVARDLSGKIGFVFGILVDVIIWPIIVSNTILSFLGNN